MFRLVRSRFLQLALMSPGPQLQISEGVKGTTMEGLNMQILGGLLIAIPPISEQDSILAEVGSVKFRIDHALAAARQSRDLLQEYRTRLIADVVTGKLDVSEAAANLPDEADDSDLPDQIEDQITSDAPTLDSELLETAERIDG